MKPIILLNCANGTLGEWNYLDVYPFGLNFHKCVRILHASDKYELEGGNVLVKKCFETSQALPNKDN